MVSDVHQCRVTKGNKEIEEREVREDLEVTSLGRGQGNL